MHGLHLTADLYRCRCDATWLTDAQALGDWCAQAARTAQLAPLDRVFHGTAAGVDGAMLLAQAHLAVHTARDQRRVLLDMCVAQAAPEHKAKARALMAALVERFQPEWTEQRSLDRGDGE